MIEGKTQSELDQAEAFMIEYYPRIWMALYKRMQEEGFSKEQAMDLLRVYIASSVK